MKKKRLLQTRKFMDSLGFLPVLFGLVNTKSAALGENPSMMGVREKELNEKDVT
jgi:hypothetical protein